MGMDTVLETLQLRVSILENKTTRNTEDIEKVNAKITESISKAAESRLQMHMKIDEVNHGLAKMEINLLNHIDGKLSTVSNVEVLMLRWALGLIVGTMALFYIGGILKGS